MFNIKWIFKNWYKVIDKGLWIANAHGNHDFAKMVSLFGNDDQYLKESTKMLIIMVATQNNTLNIYQGNEIGMTNIQLNNIDEVNDIQS